MVVAAVARELAGVEDGVGLAVEVAVAWGEVKACVVDAARVVVFGALWRKGVLKYRHLRA